jgi:hypothetical protein
MGINDKNFQLLEFLFNQMSFNSVFELGSQNFYQAYEGLVPGVYADLYYKLKGVDSYTCVDTNGENGALVIDLSKENTPVGKFDLVTDFGTSEHISATFDILPLYNCWTLKYHSAGSVIVGSNPATCHWPGHGVYYFTIEFYRRLSDLTGMKILHLEEHYAMGNVTDGKEVSYALDVTGSHWITLDEFSQAFNWVYST